MNRTMQKVNASRMHTIAKVASYPIRKDARSLESAKNDVPENSNPSRAGGHSRFAAVEDLIVVREVAETRAHMAGLGEVRKKFAAAA